MERDGRIKKGQAMVFRRTKIVATLGPATAGEMQIKALVEAGMDAARLNFSHGSHEEYARLLGIVRAVSAETGKPLAVIADLQGPKIRVGEMPPEGVRLMRGQQLAVTPSRIVGSGEQVPIVYSGLDDIAQPGSRILIDDGRIVLKVLRKEDGELVCRVVAGGVLTSRKGVNFPGATITAPSLTPKDRQDLEFALQTGADYVALSFVREAADIAQLRSLIDTISDRPVKIIAKIEKREAIRNIGAIIDAADAIMVARGDLGVEIAPERVPYWQKEIIRRATGNAKLVITATQMLESMIASPTPTRAEASDVANAVYDGTDAVMLSGETAIGKYPARAVATMHRIARTVEGSLASRAAGKQPSHGSVTRAISAAACEVAADLDVAAIVTPTSSGTTPVEVAKHRPRTPIVAVSPDMDVVNQLALAWGVKPQLIAPARDTDDTFTKAISAAESSGLAGPGQMIVITAGIRVNVPGTTNLIKVHWIE